MGCIMGSTTRFLLAVFCMSLTKAQDTINVPNGQNINFLNTSAMTNETSMTTLPNEDMTSISDDASASGEPPGNSSDANLTISSRGTTSRSCTLYKFFFSVIIIGGLCVGGVVGNFLAMIVLISYDSSSSKSSTPLLLGALAFSDIFVLVTVFMMKSIPNFCDFTDWCGSFMTDIFPYWLVYGWPSVDLAHAYSTFVTLVVTTHRYIAVCWPHKAKSLCTRKQGFWHLVAVITFCTLFELPVFLDFHLEVEFDNKTNTTNLLRVYSALGNDHTYQVVYKTTLYYTIMYLIPFLVLTIFTVLLVRALNKSKAMQVCSWQYW